MVPTTSILAVLLFFALQSVSTSPPPAQVKANQSASRQTAASGGYVGSKACAACHRPISDSFSRTDMGRSMSIVTSSLLAALPTPAEIFNSQQDRHFSAFVRQGRLYQSEWKTAADGKDVFRETQPVEWIIGAGANAYGGIVRHGDQLFEAPLTFYAKTQAWALSPGYEEVDRGFARPIEAACIACHSARPKPLAGATGQFENPPFEELAIGCETCHGPGAAHVRAMREGTAKSGSASIVNPAKLQPWLADNICMSCHQNGDARVLQPGKTFSDFRPGQPLEDTLAILMAPPTRDSPPDSDHVQHYFSMTLSKCYRGSNAKLSCITCHDPHVQPSGQDAPARFRAKCLTCHNENGCTASATAQQASNPPDSCIACHMPKRDITGISHSSATNHRIVATADEPFPDVTFELTTPSLPDLVHLDAIPSQSADPPPQITLLQAYGQLSVNRREYVQRYFELAKQLEASEPSNTNVLEALAASALQERTAEGVAAATDYLARAIERGSSAPWDFEQLGTRLLRAQRFPEAEACLRKGVQRAPYDAKLYALLAESYVSTNRPREAAATLRQALQLFPQMDFLRELLNEVEQSSRAGGDHR
jgi:hypothetical protein